MIEAVNSYGSGPYLLDATVKVVGFLDSVGADNVALQYDVYPMQRMERSGYGGWMGLECNPCTDTTEESLVWMRELGDA